MSETKTNGNGNGEPGGKTRRTRRNAAGAAGEDIHDMRAAANSLLDDEKARVAELAQGFATALRHSADAFAEEGNTVVARCVDQAAERVEQLSDSVRQQSWRELAAGVEERARRRPELFVAGAVAAGFILARLFAGSAPAEAAEG